MTQGVQVMGLYVRDQDEAIAFYEKLGFRVHTDVKNGNYRWLTLFDFRSNATIALFASQMR